MLASSMPLCCVALFLSFVSVASLEARQIQNYGAQVHASTNLHLNTVFSAPDNGITRQPEVFSRSSKPRNLRPRVSSYSREHQPRQDSVSDMDVPKLIGAVVFAVAALMLVVWIGMLLKLRIEFNQHHGHEDGHATFLEFVDYTLIDWFNSNRLAPALVLLQLSFGVIIAVTLLYWLLVGEAPYLALYRVFSWTTASAAGEESHEYGRLLGGTATVCGIIIVAMLMGMVTEAHSSKMDEFKMGMNKVIEGGHTVVCGFTDCTQVLLEEIAIARASQGGGVVVLLATQPKAEVEQQLQASNIKMRNSKLIVRSGSPCVTRDLMLANADAAAQVLLLRDTDVTGQEADAKNVRAVLALKNKHWPIQHNGQGGRIIVQCSCEENRTLFKGLYEDRIEVVVIAEFISRFMVQCALHSGLSQVISMVLGFEGDEFYSEEWEDLVDQSFLEVSFRFKAAVVLGVFTGHGQCLLNPGFDYVIAEGDRIIVLAEDEDSYHDGGKPYFDYESLDESSVARAASEPAGKVNLMRSHLVIGWNKETAPLLQNLEDAVDMGAKVDIYSSKTIEHREKKLEDVEAHYNLKFERLTITHYEVGDSVISSFAEVESMNHWDYDCVYVFADDEEEHVGIGSSDERCITVLSQMQRVNRNREKQGLPCKSFSPVVEICEDSAQDHLAIQGLTNVINCNGMRGQALAAVSEDPHMNLLYLQLMEGTTLDIAALETVWPEGSPVPNSLHFGLASYMVSLESGCILVGWSEGEGHDRKWEVNPKDKLHVRVWSKRTDQVVLIRPGVTAKQEITSRKTFSGSRSQSITHHKSTGHSSSGRRSTVYSLQSGRS